MQELRDIHHLEGLSRTAQIDRLQAERAETEALLSAAQDQSSATSLDVARLQAEVEHAKAEADRTAKVHKEEVEKVRKSTKEELDKAVKSAKEEEEKRVKAISLLKNVRSKGMKTEKDLEEVQKERDALKEELAKEREAGRAKDEEMERMKRDHALELAKVRAQAAADLNALRVKLEREAGGKQSSYEAETANLKVSLSFLVLSSICSRYPTELTCKRTGLPPSAHHTTRNFAQIYLTRAGQPLRPTATSTSRS